MLNPYLKLPPTGTVLRLLTTTTDSDSNLNTHHNKQIDLFMVNIQGLITTRQNKCPHLDKVSKIIAVTETWGKRHHKTEYLADNAGFDINVFKRKAPPLNAAPT